VRGLYEIVLVDDDALVIEFLKKLIPWQDYGFQVAAHFQDSCVALDYLQNHAYDVLITDIGMPKLNGIELIEQLKKSHSNSYHVILSCHDEFRFAQQALKLEVYDYILKETMEETNIMALLERLKNKLDQKRLTNHQNLKVSKFLEKNHMTLKSTFIEKLMEKNVEKTDWRTEQEELLGMNFSHEYYTPVLSFIDQYQVAATYYGNETLLQFSVNNVVEEILAAFSQEIQTFFLKGTFFMLFPSKSNKTLETQPAIELILKEIHRKIRTYLNISITSVIGEQNVQHQQLIKNMRLLLENKEQRFYYQHDSIHYFRLLSYTSDSIFQDYVEIAQKLKELILKDKKKEVLEVIYRQLSKIREKKYDPEVVKDWVIKLIFDIKLSLQALKHFETESMPLNNHLIQHVETLEHLESVLKDLCEQFIEQGKSIDLTSRNEDVLKAQKYVQTHLREKISLTEVAAHLHLNSSYFSRMYKKETGEGFVEYVTRVKMEKAIELLDHSIKSVEQIAYELGFESKSYFLKTFKRYFGYSPKSYKYKEKDSV
jgi:two-component system, response regulator YesN